MKTIGLAMVFLLVAMMTGPVMAANTQSASFGEDFFFPGLNGTYWCYDQPPRVVIGLCAKITNASVDSLNSSFRVSPEHPEMFEGSFSAAGLLDDFSLPSFNSSRSSLRRGGALVEREMNIFLVQPEPPAIQMWFQATIVPATITDIWLNYDEYDLPWEEHTVWYLHLGYKGHFVADTLADAQAIGSQFLIPEPTAVSALFIGGSAVLLRRRWR